MRKKKKPVDEPQAKKNEATTSLRAYVGVVKMVNILAREQGVTVADYLDSLVYQIVLKDYHDWVRGEVSKMPKNKNLADTV